MTGYLNTTKAVLATNDPLIDGVLTNVAWGEASIDVAFSITPNQYFYNAAGLTDLLPTFNSVSVQQQTATLFALDKDNGNSVDDGFSVEGFTNLGVNNLGFVDSGYAEIRIAQTSFAGLETAMVGDFPGNDISGSFEDNGDVWFGTAYDYRNPIAGNYEWLTMIHELGHALGLSHGHQTWEMGALPYWNDSMENSIMTYRSYVGQNVEGGYTNEDWGFAQTFMRSDIAALQHMYGANYTTNSGDTVYKWNPNEGTTYINGVAAISPGANKIFATIWDGGGIDTYDLSAYSGFMTINLQAGGYSHFSTDQKVDLGDNQTTYGNIYNSYLHNGDLRSLIENVVGGSGNDHITGNEVNNVLEGSGGNDHLYGNLGDDTLIGGAGNDTLWGETDNDLLYGNEGDDTLNGDYGNDTLIGGSGNDEINGGNGDDRIYYDAADSWGNIDGGEGTDTLVILGGSLPVQNLSAANIEFAEHVLEDTSNQFEWQAVNNQYTHTWLLRIENVAYDDGQRTIKVHDVYSNESYFNYTSFYNNLDLLYAQQVVEDSGSSWLTNYDAGNVAWHSQFTTYYNGLGQTLSRDVTGDDGSGWIEFYNPTGIYWYDTYTVYRDTNGATEAETVVSSSGSGWTTTFDKDAAFWYNLYTTFFNSSGQTTSLKVVGDDDSGYDTFYDPDDSYYFTTYDRFFNSSNEVYRQDVYKDDGGKIVTDYDIDNEHAWSEYSKEYSSTGDLVAEYGQNDDGSYWVL